MRDFQHIHKLNLQFSSGHAKRHPLPLHWQEGRILTQALPTFRFFRIQRLSLPYPVIIRGAIRQALKEKGRDPDSYRSVVWV